MKRYIMVIIILMVLSCLQSAPRSLSEARIVSENFLQQRGKAQVTAEEFTLSSDGNTLYIFNLADDGFVVTSSDDIMYPVAAYSWLGTYNAESAEDLQFRFIAADQALRREYYASERSAAEENREAWEELLNGIRPERTFQQWPMEGTTYTEGWCESQWTQSGVFNQFCPIDTGGNRSVVGCVATAMAQIMHFHEYVGAPTFSNSDDYHSGWWETIHIDNDHEEYDFPSWDELNELISEADEHYSSGAEITSQDMAAVSYACGVSVEMSYSSEGSGAYTADATSAFVNKFNYDTAVWNEGNGNNFYNNIAEDMKQMQPCEFSIYTDGWNDGHAIVCDGYNTDDYYHLNYGWGSTNLGWYFLPEGMPSNYSIIGGAVRNIEGGEHPVSFSGSVSGPTSLSQCRVVFTGEDYSYEAYTDNGGSFEVPALKAGMYSVSALSGRAWYVEEEIYIAEDMENYTLEMYNYEALTGVVESTENLSGAVIALYEGDEQLALTTCDADGVFSIADVLPGTYIVTASLSPGLYGESVVTVSEDNQFAMIELIEYPETGSIGFYDTAAETYSLVPIEVSCAVKLMPEDMADNAEDVFMGVSFICPIAADEGSITAQLWQGDALLVEKQVTDFSYGEEIVAEFPYFISIDEESEYYAGYQIDTATGVIAWRDNGPREIDKGAWFRVKSWTELSTSFDFNFCIEALYMSTTTGITAGESEIISSNTISAVYPNPFSLSQYRGDSRLQLELAEGSEVKVELYNLKGQRAGRVYDGYLRSGTHEISWQPSGLSSGVYFYQLSINGRKADQQKTIILK